MQPVWPYGQGTGKQTTSACSQSGRTGKGRASRQLRHAASLAVRARDGQADNFGMQPVWPYGQGTGKQTTSACSQSGRTGKGRASRQLRHAASLAVRARDGQADNFGMQPVWPYGHGTGKQTTSACSQSGRTGKGRASRQLRHAASLAVRARDGQADNFGMQPVWPYGHGTGKQTTYRLTGRTPLNPLFSRVKFQYVQMCFTFHICITYHAKNIISCDHSTYTTDITPLNRRKKLTIIKCTTVQYCSHMTAILLHQYDCNTTTLIVTNIGEKYVRPRLPCYGNVTYRYHNVC